MTEKLHTLCDVNLARPLLPNLGIEFKIQYLISFLLAHKKRKLFFIVVSLMVILEDVA